MPQNRTKNKTNTYDNENKNENKSNFTKYTTIITIFISLFSLIFSYDNNKKIRNLNDNKYNLATHANYDAVYDIKFRDDSKTQIFINDDNKEECSTEIDKLVLFTYIGGIDKAYLCWYHNDQFYGMERFIPHADSLDSRKSDSYEYYIDAFTIDKEANNNGNWYGTVYLIVKDFKNNYSVKMIVFEFDKNNNMLNHLIYDEEQAKLLVDSENLKVIRPFDYARMEEFNDVISKVEDYFEK